MRASRRLTLAASAVVLVAPLAVTAVASSTAAAATSKVVKLTAGLPPRFQTLTVPCEGDTFAADSQQVHVRGPATPPLGKGSLELRGGGLQFMSFGINKPASAVTTEAISVHGPSSLPYVGFAVELVMNFTASGDDLLEETPADSGPWHRYQLTTDPVEEVHEDSSGTRSDVGPTTYADYVAAHTGSTVSGATTTYDFEPDNAVITDRAPTSTPTRTQTTVAGFITRAGKPAGNGDTVDLYARPKGAKSWSYAGSVPISWNGAVYSEQFLTTDTTFQWRHVGSSVLGLLTSKPFTVYIKKPPKKKH